MTNRSGWAAAGLALGTAAVVALGYAFPQSLTATALPQPQGAQVGQRTTVCPGLGQTAEHAESVTVFEGAGAADATGQIDGAAAEPLPLPAPGQAVRVAAAEPNGAITVRATGESAGRTATAREYLDPVDEGRGLALASCVEPRAEWWFAGVSAETGHIDELLLANPTRSPAVVSISVLGPAGQIDVVGAAGVVVQPGEQAVIRVDSLIPGIAEATLRVSTSGGLVSAALRATSIDGLIPQGAEYIPAAAPPATKALVPGVLGGEGSRRLVLASPEADAAVEVSYLTQAGVVERSTAGQIPVPAGSTVVVDIGADLGGQPAAVRISASAPVTAAVQSVVKGILPPEATGVLNRVPVADMAWTAAAQPIGQRWTLPITGVGAAPATLLLSSLDGPTSLTVTTRAANGAASEQIVQVDRDSLQVVAVPVTEGAASIVDIQRTAGEGRLFAAVVQTGAFPDGPVATAAIGSDPSTDVIVPLAYPDPQVLAGG